MYSLRAQERAGDGAWELRANWSGHLFSRKLRERRRNRTRKNGMNRAPQLVEREGLESVAESVAFSCSNRLNSCATLPLIFPVKSLGTTGTLFTRLISLLTVFPIAPVPRIGPVYWAGTYIPTGEIIGCPPPSMLLYLV